MASTEEPARINKKHIEILSKIKDGWMLRECDAYKEEYSSCSSIHGRFQQFYVHGKALDCSEWEKNFQDCKLWNSDADEDAANRIIEREKERIKKRLEGHYRNPVWEKRIQPPSDWNPPLPDWIKERQESSYLKVYIEENEKLADRSELDKKVDAAKIKAFGSDSCTIL